MHVLETLTGGNRKRERERRRCCKREREREIVQNGRWCKRERETESPGVSFEKTFICHLWEYIIIFILCEFYFCMNIL